MRTVPFVDAHVHLWELTRLRYAWLTPPFTDDGPNGSVAAIASNYRPADYRAEAANWNVAGYVHVEAGANPADALAETAWLQSLDDGPAGLVAFAALDDPSVDSWLSLHAGHGKLRGVRHIVNWHPEARRTYTPRDVTRDEAWIAGFGRLASHRLSFDLQAYPAQFPALAQVFQRHPDVPVIVNHLGMPVPGDPDGAETWRTGLRALAALPQVAIKISGFGFVRRPWTVADARPWVLEAIDLFGADRACVASDFPTDRLFGTFDHTLGAYADILADFSDAEKRALWGGNANRLYRLGLQLQDSANG